MKVYELPLLLKRDIEDVFYVWKLVIDSPMGVTLLRDQVLRYSRKE